jgi:putative transposase
VTAWGLNVVVLALRIPSPWGREPLALPVMVCLHRKSGKGATGEEEELSLIELAAWMVFRLIEWLPNHRFRLVADGRPFKALAMSDEFTRESIGRELRRSIKADDVVKILDQAKAVRGAPEYIRMDNGPELVAAAIRDWCKLSGTRTVYIEPGSPGENPFVESFDSRARDELFSREVFHSVLEGGVMYFDWCHRYNHHRPHSAIGYLPPAVFAALIALGPTLRGRLRSSSQPCATDSRSSAHPA